MIEPEVDHDLFELPVAVRGAEQLGLHELKQGLSFLAYGLGLLRAHFPLRRCHLRGLLRLLTLQRPPGHLRREIELCGHLLGALGECVEGGQPGGQFTVVNAFRMELLIDVGG